MANVSLDERGLIVDGKRRWLMSGTIDPARTPAALWPDRLRSAAAAGFNAVLVPAVGAEEHLQILSSLSRALMHEDARETLLAADDAETVQNTVREAMD